MKSPIHDSFPLARRSLIAAALSLLLGTSLGVAQTTSSGTTSTSGTSASENARRESQSQADQDSRRDTYGTSRGATGSSSTDTAGGATTATGRATTTDTDAKLSWGDKRFLTKTADHSKAELNLAQLAAQKASNPEVRSFAEKLVSDHSMATSDLTRLAGQKNVELDMDEGKDRTYRRLSEKSGSEFDQEFVEQMVEMHEEDVERFEEAASDAKDPEIRSFASKHVSALREHLQHAQQLRQTIMPTGRTNETSGRTSGPTESYDTGSSRRGTSGTTGPDTSTGSTRSTTDPDASTEPDTSSTQRDNSR